MLFPPSSPGPPAHLPTRVEPAAKSPALILASGPDRCLALGQPRAEGPGLPSVYHCSGHSLAILSEVPCQGPLPSSDPQRSPLSPFWPPRAHPSPSPSAAWRQLATPGEPGLGWAGLGLFPCSVCSVKFVMCKESLNSCIFKREKSYLTLLCSRFTYTHSLELSFSFNIVKILKESCNFILFLLLKKKIKPII